MTAAAPIEPSTARHLHHLLATEQRTSRLPSVAAGIVRDGSLAWSDAVGTLDGRAEGLAADADTQYRMGSITKTFVAVAVLQLRDRGQLDLLDRFDEHVPGTAFGDVTIAQLLSHGAGLQAETDGPWWERTAGVSWDDLAAAPVRQRFRAGRRFHYTNVGFAALGELVARAHGADWFEVVRRDLLEPLGMTRTTTRPTGKAAQGLAVHPFADVLLPEPEHDAGAMAPAGQLWSTVEDLGRWATFAGGDTGDVLAADTLEEMLEPHTLSDNPGQPWTAAHGLGWQVWNLGGRRYAGHGGSMPGFLAGLRVDVETGDGVVVLANTTAGMRPVGSDLLAAFVEREPRMPQVWHASGDPSVLDVVGMWHWGPSVTVARAVGEHLVLGEPGQARGSRFAPVGADEWVGLDGYYTGEPLRLVRRADGTASHLDLASFRFTRTPYDPDADVPGGVHEAGWR
ncbi:serine hydrolase domain-containing protein [Humibacillus xanthopallidus]|uniref:CubicO group peptidase (Beta-lactamase class C family) n=1 Tax=Humibacillus xanthopallidus TaxID=412689 RepID=A0A543I1P6_9MICO|nr:serine hydrolase domain-containing protein [Humibacillus xanthopallidus]TQM64475.1 CubicO group peptidase (beta-lactamase class C family) [Humibacillus xanthopallidus]